MLVYGILLEIYWSNIHIKLSKKLQKIWNNLVGVRIRGNLITYKFAMYTDRS